MELSTQFYLNAKPVESSIQVSVNGHAVPRTRPTAGRTTPPPIQSFSTARPVPASGASVLVNFDPEKLQL